MRINKGARKKADNLLALHPAYMSHDLRCRNYQTEYKMRVWFVRCETFAQAEKEYSWASKIVASQGGFRVFESIEDYEIWINGGAPYGHIWIFKILLQDKTFVDHLLESKVDEGAFKEAKKLLTLYPNYVSHDLRCSSYPVKEYSVLI